jgi:hypothetical protein
MMRRLGISRETVQQGARQPIQPFIMEPNEPPLVSSDIQDSGACCYSRLTNDERLPLTEPVRR